MTKVPSLRVRSRFGLRAGLLVAAGALSARAAAPKAPQPAVRFKLEALGFPGFSKNFIDAGASMLTAHFVDADHLLLTYSLRGLVERTAEDTPEDEPRAVAALLLDAKTGEVLARARWHLHDHARYLYPLGNGRFLLRVRNSLRAFAPLENLKSGDAFRETPLIHIAGKLDEVLVSPGGDLLTVESELPPKKPEPGSPAAITFSGGGGEPPPAREQITFLRISGTGSEQSPLRAMLSGTAHAAAPGHIPITSRGFLYAAEEGRRGDWTVQFDVFNGGPPVKLAPVTSSCQPSFQFVGPAQFLAVTCRGDVDRLMLSSFDFVPRETWEEPFSGPMTNPYFVSAPAGGRFAFSHELSDAPLLSGPSGMATAPDPAQVRKTQEIRVYQAESGDLLLKVQGSPSLRAGQDFDLAPDGMSALVLHDGALEIYRLPELKKEDREDLAEVHAHEPPAVTADRLEIRRVLRQSVEAEEPQAAALASGTGTVPASAPTEANTIVNGDALPAGRRSAPSLLAPGENADSKTAGSQSPK